MDSREYTCKKCNEVELGYCKTGASIDGKYYCQVCYDKILNAVEDEIVIANGCRVNQ